MPRLCNVTQVQWDGATERYELGYIHANHLARELGVSPQTVMREMRKRGAKKGSRAFETVVDLVAELDRKALHRAHIKSAALNLAILRSKTTMAMLDAMMGALMEADRQGDLRRAKVAVDLTKAAVGSPKRMRSLNL